MIWAVAAGKLLSNLVFLYLVPLLFLHLFFCVGQEAPYDQFKSFLCLSALMLTLQLVEEARKGKGSPLMHFTFARVERAY